MSWAREKQLLDAGAQQAIAEALRAQLHEIDAANAQLKPLRSWILLAGQPFTMIGLPHIAPEVQA